MRMKMMKYHFMLIATALFYWACNPDPEPRAQKERFFVKLYGGLLQEEGFDLKQTSDGGFILVGSSNTPGISQNDQKDIYVIKVNALGDEEWVFSYGASRDDVGKSILEKSSGGYIIAGDHGFENGNSSAVILELDANGSLVNEILFSMDSSFSSGAEDIKEIGPDQYLVTGLTTNVNTNKGTFPGDTHDVLTFIVEAGAVVAESVLGFSSTDLGVGGNIVYSGNNPIQNEFLIIGTASDSPLANQDQSMRSDNILAFTVRFENGVLTSPINGPTYGVAGTDQKANEINRVNAGYIIVGSSERVGQDIFFLQIVGNSANSEQIKTEIDLGGGDDEGVSVKQLIQGQYIIAGNTNSFTGSESDIFLLKMDGQGNVLQDWLVEPRTFGFDGEDKAGKVIVTSDGGFAIVGTITIDGSSPDDQNRNTLICLIKTDSEGRLGN